jgi:hypothetical protein
MKDDGGAAFPGVEYTYYNGVPQVGADHVGMSLRDWFAGQAGPLLLVELFKNNTFTEALEKVGEHSYQYANAMLAERNKGE